jgi:hypothetical protein
MGFLFDQGDNVTSPTCFHFGRAIAFFGLLALLVGAATYFLGDNFAVPASAWPALGVPVLVIGVIFTRCGTSRWR